MASSYNNYIHNIAKQCVLAEPIEHALNDGYKVCHEYAILNESITSKAKNIFGAGLVALSALTGTGGLTGCKMLDDFAHDDACGHYIQNNDWHTSYTDAIKQYHIDTDAGKKQLIQDAMKVADSLYMTNTEGELASSYIKHLVNSARNMTDFHKLANAVNVGYVMLNSINSGKCSDGLAYEEEDIDKYPYSSRWNSSSDDSFMELTPGFSDGEFGFGFGSGVPGFNIGNIDNF